jgi:hypothetical protein
MHSAEVLDQRMIRIPGGAEGVILLLRMTLNLKLKTLFISGIV